MTNHYCHFGKCECGAYYDLTICGLGYVGENSIGVKYEVCPWPSRKLMDSNLGTNRIYANGYLAGRREQARVDREAVIKYTDGCHHKNPDGVAMCIELPALLAALREAGK